MQRADEFLIDIGDCGCEWEEVATNSDQLSSPSRRWISSAPVVPSSTGGHRPAGVAFTRLVCLGPRRRNGIPRRCLVGSRYQTNGTLQAPLIPQADLQNEFYMVVSAPSGNRCGFHRGRIVSPGNSYVWICHVVFTRGVFVIGCMSSKRVLNTSINPECWVLKELYLNFEVFGINYILSSV